MTVILNPYVLGVSSGRSEGGGGPPPTTSFWDAARKGGDIALAGGDLTAIKTAAAWQTAISTTSKADKRYFELTYNALHYAAIAVCNGSADVSTFAGASGNGVMWSSDGSVFSNGGFVTNLGGSAAGDVVGAAVNPLSGEVKFYRGGSLLGAVPVPGLTGVPVFAAVSLYGAAAATANFLPASAPSGYAKWDA